jgi:uncharacterized phage protein (TIGR01671 family)
MNREIKFRAWDSDFKRWVEPATIAVVSAGLMFYIDGRWKLDYEPTVRLMQFTGLKDKKGKEVYEGDILRQHWPNDRISLARIYFNEDLAGFKARNIVTDDWTKEGLVAHLKEQRDNGYIISLSQDSEVIGNIYENPELLK